MLTWSLHLGFLETRPFTALEFGKLAVAADLCFPLIPLSTFLVVALPVLATVSRIYFVLWNSWDWTTILVFGRKFLTIWAMARLPKDIISYSVLNTVLKRNLSRCLSCSRILFWYEYIQAWVDWLITNHTFVCFFFLYPF